MDVTYQTEYGFLEVVPSGKLTARDFQNVAEEIARIRQSGQEFKGILIWTKSFPGYRKFSDLLAHGKFIKHHHDKVGKVAVCTDSRVGRLLQTIGNVYAEAEVRKFRYEQKNEAENWLRS